MNICIVEDDDYKMRDLLDWAESHYPGSIITRAESFRSGAHVLKNGDFDFILLDMQLKLYDDAGTVVPSDKMSIFGGERLLRQLERSEKKASVIMVTQYTTFSEKLDEVTFSLLCKRLSKSCPNVFKGGVQYLVGSASWHDELFEITKNK